MAAVIGGTHRSAGRRVVLCLAACLLGILVATPSALGQAAVDQYIPKAGPEGTTGSDPSGDGVGSVAGHPNTARSDEDQAKAGENASSEGELPVVGYPSTPFTMILAVLLGLGLLAGLGTVAARRWRQPAGQ
jgi:hypothetical protein